MSCKQLAAVVVLLSALAVRSAGAQVPPLTNADIRRLAAIGVSEQTVIAVIRETSAVQFDLSAQALSDLSASGVSTAVLAAMHSSLTPASPEAGARLPPAADSQTLAGAAALAAAQAAAAPSAWRPGLSIKQSGGPSTSVQGAQGGISGGSGVADETYWKNRMRALQAEYDDGVVNVAAAEARVAAIVGEVSGYARMSVIQASNYDRERIQANNELSRLRAVLANALRAMDDLREEARRAGVPPGVLRP